MYICIYIYCRHTLETLERTLQRIKEDLSVKTNSLNIDDECTNLRLQLAEHPNADKIMMDEAKP